MPNFLDLPLEIRLLVYRELELPQAELISLGKFFAAEAAYACPSQILQVSRQVSREARMAFSATSKRPWKINVIASADAKLSLPDVLPDGLAQAAHIQFNFEFPRERDSLATLVRMQGGVSIETQKRITRMKISSKKAVHQVGCGIDEICRRLAEDPVKRDMEICWSDFVTFPEWETRKTVLQPFSRLRESCSFRLGEVLGMQDDARQRLASYWEIVTSRVSV